MEPKDLSRILRQIAAGIDRAENPSRNLVASELKKLVNRLASKPEMVFWNYGKGSYIDDYLDVDVKLLKNIFGKDGFYEIKTGRNADGMLLSKEKLPMGIDLSDFEDVQVLHKGRLTPSKGNIKGKVTDSVYTTYVDELADKIREESEKEEVEE